MARYFTRPQPVDAVQWHSDDELLPGTAPAGCRFCGPNVVAVGRFNACPSPAAHDPVRRPHHLVIAVGNETVPIFDGYWLVTFADGTKRVYAPSAFDAQFTEDDLEAIVENVAYANG